MPDLATYTDDALDALRVEVLTEQERRARIAEAPGQIAALARDALECGADPDALRAAVEEGLEPSAGESS